MKLMVLTKWVWFHKKIVYIAAENWIWRVSGGMSESQEFKNKYVIIVAAIIFGCILLVGLAGVGLTLVT